MATLPAFYNSKMNVMKPFVSLFDDLSTLQDKMVTYIDNEISCYDQASHVTNPTRNNNNNSFGQSSNSSPPPPQNHESSAKEIADCGRKIINTLSSRAISIPFFGPPLSSSSSSSPSSSSSQTHDQITAPCSAEIRKRNTLKQLISACKSLKDLCTSNPSITLISGATDSSEVVAAAALIITVITRIANMSYIIIADHKGSPPPSSFSLPSSSLIPYPRSSNESTMDVEEETEEAEAFPTLPHHHQIIPLDTSFRNRVYIPANTKPNIAAAQNSFLTFQNIGRLFLQCREPQNAYGSLCLAEDFRAILEAAEEAEATSLPLSSSLSAVKDIQNEIYACHELLTEAANEIFQASRKTDYTLMKSLLDLQVGTGMAIYDSAATKTDRNVVVILRKLAGTLYRYGAVLAKEGEAEFAEKTLASMLKVTDIILGLLDNEDLSNASIKSSNNVSFTLKMLAVVSEARMYSSEAFFILAHMFANADSYEKAYACLDKNEGYVEDGKKQELMIFELSKAGLGCKPSEAQALLVKSEQLYIIEKAKIVFARTMLAHKRGDFNESTALLNILISSTAIRDDKTMFKLSLQACSAVYLDAIARMCDSTTSGETAQRDVNMINTTSNPYDKMCAQIDDSEEEVEGFIFDIKLDEVLCTIAGLDKFMERKHRRAAASVAAAAAAAADDEVEGMDVETEAALALARPPSLTSYELTTVLALDKRARAIFTGLVSRRDDVAANSARYSGTLVADLTNKLSGAASKAVSFFRIHDCHDSVLSWINLLLPLLKSGEKVSKKELADALAAGALSQTMSSTTEESLSKAYSDAGQAVEHYPKSARNLAIWFQCGVRAERGGLVQGFEFLIELGRYCKSCQSSGIRESEMLAAYSMMSFVACDLSAGGELSKGFVLSTQNFATSEAMLWVMSHWVDFMSEGCRGGYMKAVLEKRTVASPSSSSSSSAIAVVGSPDLSLADKSPRRVMGSPLAQASSVSSPDVLRSNHSKGGHPISSLILLLRSFLVQLELHMFEDPDILHRFGSDVVTTLDNTISLIVAVRNRALSSSSDGGDVAGSSAEDEMGVLIFDDTLTRLRVGDQKDVIWVAEQMWNLGLNAMKGGEYLYAAAFFSKAHDFALVSNEEEGKGLSRNCLDFEFKEKWLGLASGHERGGNKVAVEMVASELSSEFSSQCLVMSCCALLDNISGSGSGSGSDNVKAASSGAGSGSGGTDNDNMKRSLWQIKMAKLELESFGIISPGNKTYIEFLTLRCIVEVADDSEGVTFLNSIDEAACCKMDELQRVAERALENRMNHTAKILYEACVNDILQSIENGTGGNSDHTSSNLGALQMRVIRLTSSVAENVRLYEKIAELCSRKGKSWYTSDEINYYCVAAFNKGCNLLYLGDVVNAEALLGVALNLVPHCEGETVGYADVIRSAFGKAVEVKGDRDKERSGASKMVTLFAGLAPVEGDV